MSNEDAKNLIHVQGDYYIGADNLQYILIKKYTPENKEPYYVGEKFCTTIKSLYDTIFNMELRENVDLLNNLDAIAKLNENTYSKLLEVQKQFKLKKG